MTARFGAAANPLADARGSDRSPDGVPSGPGGVALNSTESRGRGTGTVACRRGHKKTVPCTISKARSRIGGPAMHLLTNRNSLLKLAGVLLLLAGLALAQRPKENVAPGRHPNLAAAQRLSQQAWQRIVAAQEANEFDMQGHPQKAKNLLDEVTRELKLAAESAKHEGR